MATLIRTWVLDRINCRWVLKWLTAGARSKLPHVALLAAGFACGPATPPGNATPPPTTPYLPTVPYWTPPAQVVYAPPSQVWLPTQTPLWYGSPSEEGKGYPISLGPAIPGPEQGEHRTDFFSPVYSPENIPPICDILTPTVPSVSAVDAPGPFMWFLTACVLLFIWKALPLQASKTSD